MPAPTIVTLQQFARRIGLPDAPVLIDVRTQEDAAADPRSLPGAIRRGHADVSAWAGAGPSASSKADAAHVPRMDQATCARL